MNLDRDPTDTDEYSVTASQIFDYCGADKSGVLHVDALMEKFAPFVRTNKAEFSYLKNLLDPEQSNPEINVTKLANTLHRYSESQKIKIDLDESFNLRNGQAPQDSDSGISSDGLQLLEELQCELKEKEHLAHKLRSQLDFTDRQHEETIAGLMIERDALKKSLNIAREENVSLAQLRVDYEEATERAVAADGARAQLARDLDALRKRNKLLDSQITALETDKLTLQELLSKSKEECHRINEMYASRQSFLLEQNEALKAERADLAAKVQDFEDYTQQILNEKLLLEMELKDSISKYNQSHLRLDRSIDVSYTDDNVLTQLDSLNADSRFAPDQTSVSTQVETACIECEKRSAVVPHRSFRKFFWDGLKCLFQIFAVVCFVCALTVLYGVSRRDAPGCREGRVAPWRWLSVQDLMDLLLRIEYTADVPM